MTENKIGSFVVLFFVIAIGFTITMAIILP
jgi:hypothetical protein